MEVFVKFCVGMNLPLVPEEGLLAYTKLCLCFYLFTPHLSIPFVYQVKQKTLIIWGEDDQIISNKLAMVSKFYGYEASNATDK